jgi:hypothetical protein
VGGWVGVGRSVALQAIGWQRERTERVLIGMHVRTPTCSFSKTNTMSRASDEYDLGGALEGRFSVKSSPSSPRIALMRADASMEAGAAPAPPGMVRLATTLPPDMRATPSNLSSAGSITPGLGAALESSICCALFLSVLLDQLDLRHALGASRG